MKMTPKQVADMIRSIGIPFAYHSFPDGPNTQAPDPPFICFMYTSSDGMYADDSNFTDITGLAIELYTDAKNFTIENTVETVLKQSGFSYSKNETYLTSERMVEVIYEMEVILDNG